MAKTRLIVALCSGCCAAAPRMAEPSAQLALAVGVLFEADEDLTLRQLWMAIESFVPRAELKTAATTVGDLAHAGDR